MYHFIIICEFKLDLQSGNENLGRDLCDLDLWPWHFAWTLPWSKVITPENFMMIRWWEHSQQERQGRWCIFDTGWSHWINYLVKEDTMQVAWPGSNEIILVSGMKIVAKSQSDLWRLIMNSSAKFKADSISGVYAKKYHRIGTSNTNSAKDVH